jgi:hypothetical protein
MGISQAATSSTLCGAAGGPDEPKKQVWWKGPPASVARRAVPALAVARCHAELREHGTLDAANLLVGLPDCRFNKTATD